MAKAGRPERPVDPAQGPLQSFAHELRELRRRAGNPSYRTLADRTHYSRTAISDAARGERLPTVDVTLAFVEACRGDPDEWRARWHLCRQQITRSSEAVPTDGLTGPAMAGDEAGMPAVNGAGRRRAAAPRPGKTRLRTRPAGSRLVTPVTLVAFGITVLAQAEAVIVWHVARSVSAARIEASGAASIPVMDGADPRLSNCGSSATVLDRRPVRLPVPTTIASRSLHAGTLLGTVSLRYSARCAAAWARFDPAPGIFSNQPGAAALLLVVSRPADGTQSTWRMPHVEEAYGDLLLTGLGCVVASASIELMGQQRTATAHTRCLPHP
jgi:hypothetical protein